MNIVFLYTELAEYFLACVRRLLKVCDADVHIVRWPVNSEAPFDFDVPDRVRLYNRGDFDKKSLRELIDSLNPELVFCSGWMDNVYTHTAAYCRKRKIPVVAGMDNAWTGNLRQHVARYVSPFTILRYFDYIWVAGNPQRVYAEKLGFKPYQIMEGYYSADYDLFNQLYRKYREQKKQQFPHRFLYIGRYIEHKGIRELWTAFQEAVNATASDWELWCAGTGPLFNEAPKSPSIRHLGFVQPKDFGRLVEETGVFVLPSHFEPWGVVVHEMAAAGLPLICSDEVGAATRFLTDGENGYLFKSGSVDELTNRLIRMMESDDDRLRSMGEHSTRLARGITPKIWADTLFKLTKNREKMSDGT